MSEAAAGGLRLPAAAAGEHGALTAGEANRMERHRSYRATVAAGLAVMLVALVAGVAFVGEGGAVAGEMLETVKGAAAPHSAGAIGGSLSATAIDVALAGTKREMRKKLKSLKKLDRREESLADKMDKKVDSAMGAERKKLLVAKQELSGGITDEDRAKKDVDLASSMRAQAQKLKDESEAARRKFVAQEKPVLLAQKLAEHDHKKYRSEELAVAKQVALLSEHPSSQKLRGKVDKLVKRSKEAKDRMTEDGMLLKKLEKKTANAQLGGAKGYSQLKAQSVALAKKAEGIAQTAVSLAKKGHSEKVKARGVVKAVTKAMKEPDAENAKADKAKAAAQRTQKVIREIQNKIDQEEEAKAASSQAKDVHTAAKKMSYADERKALIKEVEGSSASAQPEKKVAARHESDEQKQLKAAKNSYDELEELEEKKEKARLRKEEKKDDGHAKVTVAKHAGKHPSEGAEAEKKAKIRAAEKRAHVLSERQSTFLSGLFSSKSPWDTTKSI